MAGTGPAPKPDHLKRRRSKTPGYRQLPHEGRKGKTPDYPIMQNPDVAMDQMEGHVWEQLWKLPQAVEWERLDYFRIVARYVRTLVAAELPGADSKLLSEARQLEDRLGLTPRAMQTLRWETDEPKEEDDAALEDRAGTKAPRSYVPPS